MSAGPPNALARALRVFFVEHLPRVRGVSPHTVLSYRDALVLFLRFIAVHRQRLVFELDLGDFDADGVIVFLDHLEADRGNCAATRNARLAALHAFARYAAAHLPEQLATCQRLLAVPFKRARVRAVETLRVTSSARCSALRTADSRGSSRPRAPHHLPRHRRPCAGAS